MTQDKYACLRLENQMCFPLYAASREVIKQYRPFLDRIGLTYTQYIVMMVLWQEKKLHAGELAQRLYLDSGTLTPVLKSLEVKGLLRRYRWIQDERVLMVELTDQGAALQDQALDIPKEMAACVKLEKEDMQALCALLHKLLDAVTNK